MSRDPASGLFDSPRALLDWAHDDLGELERGMLEFYRENPCEQFTEIDPKTGYEAHKIRIVKPVPESWRRLASHALADIRHSIDQSLFAACQALTADQIDADVYFPWGTHPNDFDARMRRSKYIPEEIYPALRLCHPYPTGDDYVGGDDLIFEVRQLAGGNKHRVAIQPFAGVHEWGFAADGGGKDRWIVPYEPWDGAKQEFTVVLVEPVPDAPKPNYKINLTLGVSFGEVGPLKGQSVLGVLPYFGRYAQFVCETLEKEVTEILKRRG